MTDKDWGILMSEIRQNNAVLTNRQIFVKKKIPVEFKEESGYVKLVEDRFKKGHYRWMPF